MNCYIWNPYVPPGRPNRLKFVLTDQYGYSIAHGTQEFIEHLLKDLGVKANVEGWSIKPYRSNYYTDFLGEEDWRDVWQIVWKGYISTAEKISALPKIIGPYIGSDATDQSASFANRLREEEEVSCLVVSDFESEERRLRAQEAILNDDLVKKMQRNYGVSKPTFCHTESLGKYKQLQADLGKFQSSFFAQGANYAEHVLELCKQEGGTVHFADRL
jgi:hypothetical protein